MIAPTSTLVASYDGVIIFNRHTRPCDGVRALWKSFNADWLEVSNLKASCGDIGAAKQAFEMAAAYSFLILQKRSAI